MVKIINIFGDSYSGQAGKAGVFAKWKGRQYRRKYVIPSNPKTTMQQWIRNAFKAAVNAWHTYHSLQRLAYSYLATGLVMSGFNLLVSRWQKATAKALALPIPALEGIKQICSAFTAVVDEVLGAAIREDIINFKPVSIGSLTFTPADTDPAMQAYVDREMGDVRIPADITLIETGADGTEAVAAGDQLVISYTSGGRTRTREVLFTVLAEGTKIPAAATIALALRTDYYPIDWQSVVVESYNASTEYYGVLESMEIDNVLGKIYFDATLPLEADNKVSYTKYTALPDAKLEVTKVDTSFITWRKYSDLNGHVPIAQTVEDQTYDFVLTKGGKVSVIRAAQTAILATKHELIKMETAA